MTDANPAGAPERTLTELDRIAETILDRDVEQRPELRIHLGRPGDRTEYADHSPAGVEARHAELVRRLAEVEAAPIADEVDRVTALELRRATELEIELIDAGAPLRDVNNIATPAHDIRMTFDLMPQETEADWADVSGRLANVPAAIDGYLATLREGVASGTVAARRQVVELAEQTGEYAKQGGFFTRLAAAEGVELPESLRTELRTRAQGAAEAFGRLSIALSREIQPAASEDDAVGRELYSLHSRLFLGAAVDLDETYEWGLEELARMREEQESIAAGIAPGRSVRETAELLDREPDPAAALRAHAAGLAAERDRLDRMIAAVASTAARLENGEPFMTDTMFDGFDHGVHEAGLLHG